MQGWAYEGLLPEKEGGGMISIRDADKGRLEDALKSLRVFPRDKMRAQFLIQEVLTSIEELSQQAPVIEPRIAPMSEEDKRICYPERFSK